MRLFDEQNGAACCIKDSEVISFNFVVVMVQGFLLDGGGCGGYYLSYNIPYLSNYWSHPEVSCQLQSTKPPMLAWL